MDKLLEKYKSLNITLNLEEERKKAFEYVYLTNKLEGNKLTLVQTTQLLDTETISGENIRTRDILEQKGMYKALNRMLLAIRNKEPLSLDLIIELNGLVLSSLWKDDAYYSDAKEKGQDIGALKTTMNIISISRSGQEIERVEPLSTPDHVRVNMVNLIDRINKSTIPTIDKSIVFAKQLWLHQPFIDGNKRIGRLLINFMTMQDGYPLFVYDDSKLGNYNSLLIQEYMENKDGLLLAYTKDRIKNTMNKAIDSFAKVKKAKKDFGLSLL